MGIVDVLKRMFCSTGFSSIWIWGILFSIFTTMSTPFRMSSPCVGARKRFIAQRKYNQRLVIPNMAIQVDEITINVPNNIPLQQLQSFYDRKLRLIESSSHHLILSFGESGRIIFNQLAAQPTLNIGKGYTGLTLARKNAENLMNETMTNINVLRSFKDYKIGASIIPDEDEMKQYDVYYGWLEDPIGYRLELRQDLIQYDRLTLKVIDIDETIDFFTNILGFSLLRKRSNLNNYPKEASFSAYLGNKNETEDSTIELLYPYSTNHIDQGNVLHEISFRTDSLIKVEEVSQAKNIPIIRSTDGTILITDPNGYKFRIRQKTEGTTINKENSD